MKCELFSIWILFINRNTFKPLRILLCCKILLRRCKYRYASSARRVAGKILLTACKYRNTSSAWILGGVRITGEQTFSMLILSGFKDLSDSLTPLRLFLFFDLTYQRKFKRQPFSVQGH